MGLQQNTANFEFEIAKAIDGLRAVLPAGLDGRYRDFITMAAMPASRSAEFENDMRTLDQAMAVPNAIAKAMRTHSRMNNDKKRALVKAMLDSGAISKAQLDVGTLTNLASVTGGQSLGYVSLDTQMARGTTRPNAFTLYQCLHKSGAYQIVDYWPYTSSATSSSLPGTAFASYSSVSSGSLATDASKYNLSYITLKLLLNGRSMTTALAAQNSFVDIAAQENINAALTVLETANYACYWGNPTIFTNQYQGIAGQIPAANIYDYQVFAAAYSGQFSWSPQQTLFNLIYEAAAQITSFKQYGRITHAFMSPTAAGSLQGLVTTLLNNIVSVITPAQERIHGIVVDGELQGMRTRFGEIQFPIDLYITARDKPAQAILFDDGTNFATLTAPTKPVSVTAVVSGGVNVSGAGWTAPYVAASGVYSYAVASCDANMNESTLTYISTGAGPVSGYAVSGVVLGGAVTLTITPPGAVDAAAFRVYRSGLGYGGTITVSGNLNPASYRYIGVVAANGSNPVTFVDYNSYIPASETLFLLDLDENDMALDFRYLLPLTKVELFASNLFMPWAVCMIGSVRLKVPKFHGMVKNYVPDSPVFNPLSANPNAT